MAGAVMAATSISRPVLWALLAAPAAWIGARWAFTPDAYGFGHAIGDSGDWAAWLLLATLAVTPLRLAVRMNPVTRFLVRRRRDLGVATFAYGALHTAIYLWDKADGATILREAGGADLLTGWIALALFAPLAVTSTDGWMKALGRGWKRLHRLVWPAGGLVFAHWALTAFDPVTAYAHIALFAVIGIARLALPAWKRRPA